MGRGQGKTRAALLSSVVALGLLATHAAAAGSGKEEVPRCHGRQATIVGRRERIDALSAAFLNAAGANGAPMPAIPEMSAVWGFWGTTEAQIIDGQVDPIVGWDALVKNIQDAIDAG